MENLQRIKTLLPFVLALVAIAALACSSDDDELVSVSLALDWFPNSNHIGLFIAQEKGYFEDEGLKVNLYTPVDPSTVLQTVGAGRDDFGINYQPDVLLARAQGVPEIHGPQTGGRRRRTGSPSRRPERGGREDPLRSASAAEGFMDNAG